MSQILHKILEPKLLKVLKEFSSGDGGFTGVDPKLDPDKQIEAVQKKFAESLSLAISEAMQQYITANVITNPGQAVATAGGPTNQAGATVSPGTVTAQ
jgi:hypothetical protein